jgi:anti-sigma regulatory factor (Ser/Thr protein kinase)
LRDALSAYLAFHAIDDAVSSPVLLCAQEALTNAIERAGEGERPIAVSARISRDVFSIEVRDRGCGFDPAVLDLEAPPDPLSERGRGLFLIHRLMDDLEIVSDSHGSAIRMTIHLESVDSSAQLA